MTEAKKTSMHPISEVLCEAYRLLHEKKQVSFPLHDEQRKKIDTVVKTVNSFYFGLERFPSVEDKAVAYLYLIIKNHPVTDGNKRLSVLWFRVYCTIQKLSPQIRAYDGLDSLAVAIEESDIKMDLVLEILKEELFPKQEV